jgi:hypothetical protein
VMDWVRIVSSGKRRKEKRREGRKRRKRNQKCIPLYAQTLLRQ